MQRGQEYFAAENFAKARIEFGNALQITPDDADARYMSGRVAEKLGNLRDAVGAYQTAIDLNPDQLDARANLARVFVFGGVPERAMELIEPAIAAHPDNAELLTVRGAARVQLKDKEGALADAERAVKLAPANENAIALLASLYRQSDEPGRAVELLRNSIGKLPKSVDLRQVLASLYMSAGEQALAEAQLAQVVAIKPSVPAHRFALALLYTRAKKLDDAERVLKEGVRQLPDSRESKLAYVDFLLAQRSRAAGEKALRDFIAQDPKDLELELALATLQDRARDSTAAIATYQRVIDKDDDNPRGLTARNRIAAIHLREGRQEEGRRLITEVLAKNPRDNDALLMRGNLALEKHEPTSAIADLRAVLRDQPEAVGVMRVLARAHLANGEVALAEENLRKAATIAPRDVAIRVELAQLLGQTGRSDQAVPMLEDAVREMPSDATVREALTRMYMTARQLDRASSAAEDLKTLRPDLAVGYFLAGMTAAAQNRSVDAQRDLSKALELQPSAVDALTALTRLDIAAGRMPAAVARATAVVAREPKNAPAHNLLGELYLSQKNYSAAQAEFEAAVKLAPTWWIPYRNMGLTYLAQKDRAAAIAAYERGIVATRHELALVTDLAALQEHQGRSDEAIKLYEGVLARNPKLNVAANNLAMLLISYRKDAPSLDRARDLTSAFGSTNDGALLDTFGWVRFKRGDHAEGLTALERAAELTPDSRVVRYHLGMAQLQAGQHEKARSSLETALAGTASFAGSDEARSALAALRSQTG